MSTSQAIYGETVPVNGYIVKDPSICGGKPCIAGTRIRVQDIALHSEFGGQSADAIVREFPQLTLAQVHAALAYYFDHLDEIRLEIENAELLAARMKTRHGSPLDEKLSRLRGDDAANDSISS